MVHNELYASDDGSLRPRATEKFEELDAGLVFRSVGYRGVALPGLPFHEAWGILPNEAGRIVDDGRPCAGLYAAGWIKRGPSGVIGTNRPDAGETVKCMVEDLEAGTALAPTDTDPASLPKLLEERGITYFTFEDWKKLDEIELARGEEQGRPRVKFVTVEEISAALGR
jgi:ferredoxin--NADP+ reductase